MFDYKIIDNFLSPSYFNMLKDFLEGPHFDWYYQDNLTTPSQHLAEKQAVGFNCWIIDQEGNSRQHANLFMGFLGQVLDIIPNSDGILRCRADMTISNGQSYVHAPHVDIPFIPHYSCVFYVNESDGNTILYNERSLNSKLTEKAQIEPVPNRLVIFDGRLVHTGCSPVHSKRRIILNTNIRERQ